MQLCSYEELCIEKSFNSAQRSLHYDGESKVYLKFNVAPYRTVDHRHRIISPSPSTIDHCYRIINHLHYTVFHGYRIDMQCVPHSDIFRRG